MTKTARSIAASRDDQTDGVLDVERLQDENRELRAELAQAEPVLSAAMLTATAFRLRDHEALFSALRMLAGVIRKFEDQRACA